ncbi:hypothetical protein Leryth_016604 [Lithospermum erythrorhizon]|nr:hypothetical protein Leryth_016604 [Lithospermum erythrorhizon]
MTTTTQVKKITVAKKPKTPKTTSHPTYFQMIKEALLALHEKSGSSPRAIAKHMEAKHKAVLPSNFRKILATQLKNSAAKGKLIKVKASFKLSEAVKKITKPISKSKKTKTRKTKKVTKVAPVKPTKKRLGPKKMKAPAAKRANKASAKA